MVVPSPSRPAPFWPQHLTPPAAVSAHACEKPVAIAVTGPPRPRTSTGVALATVVPSPSTPDGFCPQQTAAPVAVTAHACSPPAAIAVIPASRPEIPTGDSARASPKNPQHSTRPVAVNAHVLCSPAASAVAATAADCRAAAREDDAIAATATSTSAYPRISPSSVPPVTGPQSADALIRRRAQPGDGTCPG